MVISRQNYKVWVAQINARRIKSIKVWNISALYKGKFVPVLNWRSTSPWKHIGEWWYSSRICNIHTRLRWVISFYPRENGPWYSLTRRQGGPIFCLDLWRKEKSCSCLEPNFGRPARSYTDCAILDHVRLYNNNNNNNSILYYLRAESTAVTPQHSVHVSNYIVEQYNIVKGKQNKHTNKQNEVMMMIIIIIIFL
jgi:hypothetical protein